jgi:hypothetical protein
MSWYWWAAADVAAAALAFAGTAWWGVNRTGWEKCNAAVGDEFAPWNWRIYLGPRRYTRWALRRHYIGIVNPIEGWDK